MMDEQNSYRITFKSVCLTANSPEEAESKAQSLVNSGEIEIHDVTEI